MEVKSDLYGASSWTQSGLVAFISSGVNDGTTNVPAFHTDSSPAGAYLKLDTGTGSVAGKTSFVVNPTITTTYVLTATNVSGTVTKSVTITVNQLPPVISTFTAVPASIASGQSATLSWTLSGGAPKSLSIDNNIGSVLDTTSKAFNGIIITF